MKPSIDVVEKTLPLRKSGEEIRVPCIVTGYPKPNVVWVDDQGNSLPINVGITCYTNLDINNHKHDNKCPWWNFNLNTGAFA